MKRQEKCLHNKAAYPKMGVDCDLREPNTLCKNCKSYQHKYPSDCCQKCGEHIGWLGRFIECIYGGLIKHECKPTCKSCGSTNIQIIKHKKITGPPKGTKINPYRKTTYGYCYNKFVCECGSTWEENTHL